MKKVTLILLLCSLNLAIASDKNGFTRKFERKIAATAHTFKFNKKVSATITVEVSIDGKTRIIDLKGANTAEAGKLKKEIEKMQFSDSACVGTHTFELNIFPE
jgi:hypothetical protein